MGYFLVVCSLIYGDLSYDWPTIRVWAVAHSCLILARVGEEDGEDSHFGFLAVMTPGHLSVNVHGIPPSREHRARTEHPAIQPESP